jgi:hypothetical protein
MIYLLMFLKIIIINNLFNKYVKLCNFFHFWDFFQCLIYFYDLNYLSDMSMEITNNIQ